jgi:hypothetical protein
MQIRPRHFIGAGDEIPAELDLVAEAMVEVSA